MNWKEDLLAEFDQEFANTRKELERLPEGKFDWKPHAKSMSLGRLAAHLANLPSWTVFTVKESSYDVAPVGKPAYEEEAPATAAGMVALFDRNVAAARAALVDLTEASMGESWSLLGSGNVYFTMPRGQVLRSMIFNHNVHHRAQLGVYLRLNDVPLPGFYGPTADE